ncbi:MAG: sugar ABC transporter permease [Phycisphaerae bacterium]|jgi:multiple sugar transport system permease protein|nr:sugar ABC transporter permease [Phycisphaerae bacterium]
MRSGSKPFLYLIPAGVVLFVFHLLPFLAVIWISLFKNWGTPEAGFAGMENYREIFARGSFLRSLSITLWYTIGTIPVTITLAMVFAAILRKKMFGGTFYRVVYFLPYITSTVAAAAVWRWIFHVDKKGLFNAMLINFGFSPLRFTEESSGIFEMLFGQALPLLGAGPSLALVSIMVFAIWQTFGFYVIIFSAGLSQIPKDVYEAAAIDGASSVRSFFSITLPMMKPILAFATIISTIGAFQTFNQIYIMAPSERTLSARNVTMFIFSQFWDNGRLGWAAAASVILFLILSGLTVLQLVYNRTRD